MFIEISWISDTLEKPCIFSGLIWREQSVTEIWTTILEEQKPRTNRLLVDCPTILQSLFCCGVIMHTVGKNPQILGCINGILICQYLQLTCSSHNPLVYNHSQSSLSETLLSPCLLFTRGQKSCYPPERRWSDLTKAINWGSDISLKIKQNKI